MERKLMMKRRRKKEQSVVNCLPLLVNRLKMLTSNGTKMIKKQTRKVNQL